jgi:catechol 2,3-dioxygenase-like lactoylglutathione lyase family enzyme
MPPTKLAHLVFQTNRLKDMRDWYCSVLGGHVVYEDPHLSFVTYDDEHHRVAFVDFGPWPARRRLGPAHGATDRRPGFHHVAFTFGSMGDLLDNYVQLKDRGIRPSTASTTADHVDVLRRSRRQRVELQIDNFATAEEGQAWMLSPAFAKKPDWVEYDPDELVVKFRSGVPVANWSCGTRAGHSPAVVTLGAPIPTAIQ